MPEFADCAARWDAKQNQGRFLPASGRSHLGSVVHAATALYDGCVDEVGTAEAQTFATDYAIADLEAPRFEVVWHDITPKWAKLAAARLIDRYATEIAPMFEWVEIEMMCQPLRVKLPSGVTIELTGTLDRIYRPTEYLSNLLDIPMDGHGIADLKTGAMAVNDEGVVKVDKHSTQLAVYEVLTMQANREELNITLPAVVVGLQTRGEFNVGVEKIETPSKYLFGDRNHPGLLQAIGDAAEKGQYLGNPMSQMCTEKYCPVFEGCYWRSA